MITRSPHNISRQGFTLIEIMVVVITLGALAALGLTNYNKVVERGHCTNAKENLRRIHSAAQIYALKHGGSGMPVLSTTATINLTFNINIEDPYFNYTTYYDPGHGPILSRANATRISGPSYICSAPFGLQLDDTNPSCNNLEYCDSLEGP